MSDETTEIDLGSFGNVDFLTEIEKNAMRRLMRDSPIRSEQTKFEAAFNIVAARRMLAEILSNPDTPAEIRRIAPSLSSTSKRFSEVLGTAGQLPEEDEL